MMALNYTVEYQELQARHQALKAELKNTVTTKYHDYIVHEWHKENVKLETKFEDLNAEYNLLLARNNVLEEMLTNERIEMGGTMYLLNNKILELEARIELALRISSNPCMPGFVSPALHGMKEKDMPSSIQALLKEDAKYEAAIGEQE